MDRSSRWNPTQLVLAVLTVSLVATAARGDQKNVVTIQPGQQPVTQWIQLGCRNPGSHQDVAKTPLIRNTSSSTLPAGTTILWAATDGDKGTVELQQALAPNGETQATGQAGNAYTCTARTSKPQRARLNVPPPVLRPAGERGPLSCRNPGSHQDVAKTPIVKNLSGQPLPPGTKISWVATDGDKGVIALNQQLAANAEVQGLGKPGNVYTCTASIGAQRTAIRRTQPPVRRMPGRQQVILGCSNPGSHQDVAKTPIVQNTTASPLAGGTKISWTASDGDKGTFALQSTLAPGGNVQALGKPGNAYTCTAAALF